MARLNPLYTSLKTLEITYKPAVETLLDTPEILPTSEPTTPQISYTVQESDLPILNIGVYRKVWIAWIFVCGYCSSSATVYYRMFRNGSSVATGSANISAGYYTYIFWFYDVNVGDVLEVKLWSSASGSDWRYKAYQIQVTRIIPLSKVRLLSPCNIVSLDRQPKLTLGKPFVYGYLILCVCHADVIYRMINAATDIPVLYVGDTYGIYRLYGGDYSSQNRGYVYSHSSYYPYYQNNYVPTKIVFRGVIIG